MNRKDERKARLSLTMLFAGLVFVFLFLTMLLVAAVIAVLLHQNVLQLGPSPLRSTRFVVIMALVSVLAGTALAATVGRYPLKPVNDIINAINRLASGDFHTRLAFRGPLGRSSVARELTDSFNRMAAELENTEMLRSDFINNFSHEFKTPIVSIAGFAKLLRRGELTPDEREEYLSVIEDEALRLSAMATNVLNMTKVENQTILTDVAEYNLSEQIRHCVLLLERKWMAKNLELELSFGEHTIRASEELLQQVWVNLLDNAVKFTPDYGLVEVSIRAADDALAVTVANSGSEIPPEAIPRLFQKFYQADESHAAEGSGVGLAIVQRVAELHGGSVAVESGGGRTAFTVTLPKR